MNQNYRMQFYRQCDYLLKFQANKRINKSILLQKWPRNAFDAKNNAYETLVLAYSKKLDILVFVNSITRSNVEEENPPPYLEDVVTCSKEEMMNLEDTTPMVTSQFATSSNELNDPPMAPSLAQHV
jgi:hypothetical protein